MNARGLLLALALTGALWLAARAAYDPEALPPAPVPPQAFWATRAIAQLRLLVGDGTPHPLGSVADGVVRERIVQRLRELGYAPEVQAGEFGCDGYARCGSPTNILVRMPGSEAGAGSVLLAAHYDSVPAGPGVADDGAGVAAILEIARALKSMPPQRHDIILLIDEGEEAGLLGAEVFVARHRWAGSVLAAVNLEARGTSGPSLMFETGAANQWLMNLYAQAVPHALTNSVYYTAYRLMPNDTDFTVFKRAGYQGFNFAFIGNVNSYHTPQDDLQHLDPRSLQQQGEHALAALLALANAGFDQLPASEAVYFDLFGRKLVRLPQGLMLPAALGLLLLSLLAARPLMRREALGGSALLVSAAAVPAAWLGAALVGEVLLLALKAIAPHGVPAFGAYPGVLTATFTALALVAIAALGLALRGRASFWSLWWAQSLWLSLLASALAASLPGVSYLPLLPAGIGVLALLLRARGGLQGALAREIAALACLLVMFTLLWPIGMPLTQALGSGALPGYSLLLVLGAIPIAGLLLEASPRLQRRFAVATASLVLAGLCLAAWLPAHTAMAPERLDIAYLLDRERPGAPVRARWLLATESGQLPREFGQGAQFVPVLRAPEWSLERDVTGLFASAAPLLALPAPQWTVRSVTPLPDRSPGQRRFHYRIQLTSLRAAPAVRIALAESAQVESVQLAGSGGGSALAVPLRHAAGGWRVMSISGLPASGAELAFDAADAVFDVRLVETAYGLPPQGAALQRARPANATAFQDGDTTRVAVTIAVPRPQ